MSAEEIEDLFVENKQEMDTYPTPLEFLLANCYNSEEYAELTEKAFMFFTHEKIMILYDIKSIWIGSAEDLGNITDLGQLRILNEGNFLDFQNAVRIALGDKPKEPPNPNEDPRIKRIKAKARYRDRVKAKQGKGIGFSTSLTSICCMGIGITPLNVGELSYAAVSELIRRYQEKEKYETDVSSLLAGADSKKVKPKYWIRNLED